MCETKLAAWIILAVLLVTVLPKQYLMAATQAVSDEALQVSTSDELIAALAPQSHTLNIHLQAGEYAIDQPLYVPDGATLTGAGVMQMEIGLPAEFEPGTETTIRASSGFEGDLLTLGNGVVLSGLRIQDIHTGTDDDSPRTGNAITVGSRVAGDTISVRIVNCEIINPNPPGVSADGPTGHGLVVLTRNPGRQQLPAPHEGSAITVSLEHSIVRTSNGGGGLFVINFAANSKVSLVLDGNLLLGKLTAGGGASRPDLVSNSFVSINSQNNLFTPNPGGHNEIGWRLISGSSAHIPGLDSPGASFNTLHIKSVDDRIDGFRTGIMATAGRRWLSASGPVSDNLLELELHGLRIRSDGEGAADLVLQGALSDTAPDSGPEFPPGDRNILRVLMQGVAGSPDVRANRYADVAGPESKTNQGDGNRLEFVGSLDDFTQSNGYFIPAPPAQFFPGSQ